MDCRLPGSSVHGILQARILKWVAIPFSGVFPTQRSNLDLPHCRWILYHGAPGEANTVERAHYLKKKKKRERERFLLLYFLVFIWLCWVLVVACMIFSCGMQTLNYGMWALTPQQGTEPRPWVWEHRVLATGLLGMFQRYHSLDTIRSNLKHSLTTTSDLGFINVSERQSSW